VPVPTSQNHCVQEAGTGRGGGGIKIKDATDTDLAGYPANLKVGHRISGAAGYPQGYLTQHLNVIKNTKKR
jgi:hypothetical protein